MLDGDGGDHRRDHAGETGGVADGHGQDEARHELTGLVLLAQPDRLAQQGLQLGAIGEDPHLCDLDGVLLQLALVGVGFVVPWLDVLEGHEGAGRAVEAALDHTDLADAALLPPAPEYGLEVAARRIAHGADVRVEADEWAVGVDAAEELLDMLAGASHVGTGFGEGRVAGPADIETRLANGEDGTTDGHDADGGDDHRYGDSRVAARRGRRGRHVTSSSSSTGCPITGDYSTRVRGGPAGRAEPAGGMGKRANLGCGGGWQFSLTPVDEVAILYPLS